MFFPQSQQFIELKKNISKPHFWLVDCSILSGVRRLNMKILKAILICTFTLVLTHCGSNNSNNSTPATTYAMSGGICYSNTGQAMPSTSYCTSTTGGYTLSSNNICYSSTGQQSPLSCCTTGCTGTYGTYPTYPAAPYYGYSWGNPWRNYYSTYWIGY
jgi:hypothetical protein